MAAGFIPMPRLQASRLRSWRLSCPLRSSMDRVRCSVKSAPMRSWLGVCATAAIIGHALGGARLAALGGLAFLYIAIFRQWDSAMLSLALIAVCVPICVAAGLFLGIWGYFSPRAKTLLITPALDL